MKIIGITGGIGCGKSSVLDFIKVNYSSYIVETDRLAHSLQQKGSACYNMIVAAFNEEILDKDGIIDRKKLGSIVFNDENKRNILNSIVHPAVTEEIIGLIDRYSKSADIFIIEAALLLESGIDKLCDEVWYIYTNEEKRRNRLIESRGYSDEKITAIMQTQLSEEIFFKSCSVVIDNNMSLENTFKQIREELSWLDNMYCLNS